MNLRLTIIALVLVFFSVGSVHNRCYSADTDKQKKEKEAMKAHNKKMNSDPNAYKESKKYKNASPEAKKKADQAEQRQRDLKKRANEGKLTPFEKKNLGLEK